MGDKYYGLKMLSEVKIRRDSKNSLSYIVKDNGKELSPIKDDVVRYLLKAINKTEITRDSEIIAALYIREIQPTENLTAYMKRHLVYWLTQYTRAELQQCIYNYKKILDTKPPGHYRIGMRNFFGKKDGDNGNMRFKEFLKINEQNLNSNKNSNEYEIMYGKNISMEVD